MKKHISAAFLVAGVVLFSSLFAVGQSASRLVEVTSRPSSSRTVPIEVIREFRSFLKYLSKESPDIGDDKAAQSRWLSSNMIAAMTEMAENEAKLAKADPTDKREYPSNGDFVGAWDPPSTYSIVGSRRYGQRAMVDVEYKWGKGTDYEGNERLVSFIFVREHGKWKLDDVYTYREEYASAQSLNSFFRQK